MKIKKVSANNRTRAFEVTTSGNVFSFPYAQLNLRPSGTNRIVSVEVDDELGKEAFTYVLESGETDTVHIDHVLHYVREPKYVSELIRHQLAVHAARKYKETDCRHAEIRRRLNTSSSHLSRLLNEDKESPSRSIGKLLELLVAMDCKIKVTVDDFVVDASKNGELVCK